MVNVIFYLNIVHLMKRIVRLCSECQDPEEVASSIKIFVEVFGQMARNNALSPLVLLFSVFIFSKGKMLLEVCFLKINSRVHQTCVFSQSERLLSSNQKCLSR
jgi:hypothetical protein